MFGRRTQGSCRLALSRMLLTTIRSDSVPPEVIVPTHESGPCSIEAAIWTTSDSMRLRLLKAIGFRAFSAKKVLWACSRKSW